MTSAIDIRYADDENAVRSCYPLMRQLRPHLDTAAEFLECWRRQHAEGYRILALWEGSVPMAIAGIRTQHNMIYGCFLYVDDLVTEGSQRSHGYGAVLMARLKEEASELGCRRLVLDSGLDNVLAHRFYYRNQLVASALHFGMQVD
ncbi:N-acetyltransferase GCN5 [Halomonas cupida]|uniref:Acetyltransferase (GNAT) family protein n=1 Tax=Halomonas cupida TaxID=44933 RepID=A0A1M6ZRX5_9GAMM|nr:GNAT family N-acetyltransferase [Halomonas cupida]GEN22667.1 N-acetyltransferase GCN5 [Halomonas cupida]SHL33222.1 Acetyltransferase (GNAT) family protein [Halomonas cupida]